MLNIDNNNYLSFYKPQSNLNKNIAQLLIVGVQKYDYKIYTYNYKTIS